MRILTLKNKTLTLDRAYIMGIVNVTPDSFSDGGKWLENGAGHALELIADGADIIDIGGESTRPGHTPVPEEEELARVLPVIKEIRKKTNVPISVDTRHERVAAACLEAGADILNSVAEPEYTQGLMEVAAHYGAGYIYTHVVKGFEGCQNPTDEIKAQFGRVKLLAEQCGIKPTSLILDPGIGFYKTAAQNIEIVKNTEKLCGETAFMMALSRKRFLGEITGKDAGDRDLASVALDAISIAKGADIVRVHDVKLHIDAVKAAYAVRGQNHNG